MMKMTEAKLPYMSFKTFVNESALGFKFAISRQRDLQNVLIQMILLREKKE